MAGLHITTEVGLRARAAKSIDQVAVALGTIGSVFLDVDEAHTLIDDLQAALRDLAAHQQATRPLQRDEENIRTAAEIREGL
ncbi:hypothetical protein [Rhodococcus sp. SJ-2]